MSIANIISEAAMVAQLVTAIPDTAAMSSEKPVVQADTVKTEQPASLEFAKSNFEYHVTNNPTDNKGRLNVFFGLPGIKGKGDTKVYSFVEFYKNGFFAKGMANTPIIPKIGTGIKTEAKVSNLFSPSIAFGLEQKVFDGSGFYGNIKVLPVRFGVNGYVQNDVTVGAFVTKGFNIPGFNTPSEDLRVDISAFGEMNVAAKGGPKWGYGEVEVKVSKPTPAGKIYISAGYNLNGNGKAMPNPQFRAAVGFHPRAYRK